MFRVIKLLFLLVILSGIGLVGFAFFGDLSPQRQVVTERVEVNVD